MAGPRIGAKCKAYRNEGTEEIPVWTEMGVISGASIDLKKGQADATSRSNNGWKAYLATLKEGGVSLDLIWNTEDASFDALFDSFLNDTVIEFAIMDDDITNSGAEGLRAHMMVFEFPRDEPLEDTVKSGVKINITPKTGYAPSWMVVA